MTIELTNGEKNVKESYEEVINRINNAIICNCMFIELTESYTVTEHLNEYEEKRHQRFQTINVNINHIISF